MPRGPDKTAAKVQLEALQKKTTSKVAADIRNNKVPKTLDGMGQAILTGIAGLQYTMNGILDAVRFQVGTPSCCLRTLLTS
jgi:hypothetical protein